MNKRALLLAANLTISAAGAGAIGYSIYADHQAGAARETRVRALVERFHGCPERFTADRECFSPDERVQMLLSAERSEREGRFEEAGRTYVSLIRALESDPMEAKAREMAGRCSSETGRSINQEIIARQEAIRRASQTVSTAGSARPVQPPQPVDAGVAPADSAQPVVQSPDAAVPDAAPAVRRVSITFRTQPPGVGIFSGDQSECVADPQCSVTVDSGNWGLEYRFTKTGYRSQTRTVTPDQDQTIEITLERERGTGRPRAPPRRSADPQPRPLEPRPNPTVISSPD